MRAGLSVSKSFITGDGCAGHTKPRPGPIAVRAIPSVSHLTRRLWKVRRPLVALRGGKEELFQTSSLAQLALVSNRWTPAALLKFDFSLQRLGRRGLRSAAKDVEQVVSRQPRILFCVLLAVFLGQNLMDRTIRLNQR